MAIGIAPINEAAVLAQLKRDFEECTKEINQDLQNALVKSANAMIVNTPILTSLAVNGYSIFYNGGGTAERKGIDVSTANVRLGIMQDVMNIDFRTSGTITVRNSTPYFQYIDPPNSLSAIGRAAFLSEARKNAR